MHTISGITSGSMKGKGQFAAYRSLHGKHALSKDINESLNEVRPPASLNRSAIVSIREIGGNRL